MVYQVVQDMGVVALKKKYILFNINVEKILFTLFIIQKMNAYNCCKLTEIANSFFFFFFQIFNV